jgi:hypothetical protein
MVTALLIALVILWLLGYLTIPFIPNMYLFTIHAHQITLWNLLTFVVLLWIVGILPRPFREISFVLLILWTLSILGIIGFIGLPSLILIAVIAGIVVYLIQGNRVIDTP